MVTFWFSNFELTRKLLKMTAFLTFLPFQTHQDKTPNTALLSSCCINTLPGKVFSCCFFSLVICLGWLVVWEFEKIPIIHCNRPSQARSSHIVRVVKLIETKRDKTNDSLVNSWLFLNVRFDIVQ